MEYEQLLKQLEDNARIISNLTHGISDERACWRPDPDSWSVLEVINHLYDEEYDDFRERLDYILHYPERPWQRIDVQGRVTEREYNMRDLEESLQNFWKAREESVAWLRELSTPDWNAISKAPFGQITAGDIFVSWVAHDLLHIRQLVELHWFYTLTLTHPYRIDFAGSW
jgi:hypothetical protein